MMSNPDTITAVLAGVVKPMRWQGPDVNCETHAATIFGVYTIRQNTGNGYWLTNVGGYFPTVDAAKASAEQDYTAKALSTLDTSIIQGLLPQWRPIDDEAKSGKEVLVLVKQRAGMPYCQLVGHWMVGGHCIDDHPPIEAGFYFWSGLMFDKASEPLLWMPLPAFDKSALSQRSAE